MTTILLVWYALWWVAIVLVAKTNGKVTVLSLVGGIFFAPLMPVILPFALLEVYSETVLWRKP